MAGPAGGAVVAVFHFHAGEKAVEGEVGEAVYFEESGHLIDGAIVGDELFAGGEIDAVKTGMADGGAGNSKVNFFGTGAADGAHLGLGGGAADDGVFDDDDAAVFDD